MNVFIIPIEPIETRYTIEWYEHLPKLLSNNLDSNVVQIDGTEVPPVTTPGAFLDFGATNIYKSSQLIKIAEMFRNGEVKPGDRFLFTDAWNTCVMQVKYMSSLLNIPVEIHGLWHAGSYDPHDFLGRLIHDKTWVNSTEKAMFHCYDYNWFATEFHIDMFKNNVFGAEWKNEYNQKCCRTGWPMEYMTETLAPYKQEKENIILFPHRLAPEKQHEIFLKLSELLPEYEFITCQDKKLTKKEYHELLGKSKMIFSANLQETLGIGVPEGMAVDAIPCVPDRLSYVEMYDQQWKYPSEWSESYESFLTHKDQLAEHIKNQMENYDTLVDDIRESYAKMHKQFFCASKLIEGLKESNE